MPFYGLFPLSEPPLPSPLLSELPTHQTSNRMCHLPRIFIEQSLLTASMILDSFMLAPVNYVHSRVFLFLGSNMILQLHTTNIE